MSRTDSHRPWWLRSLDPATTERYMFHTCGRAWRNRECDAHLPAPRNKREYDARSCTWSISHYDLSGVPRWFLLSAYHSPERQRSRIVCRNATRDWNANGDTDLQPDERQARHGAAWYYW